MTEIRSPKVLCPACAGHLVLESNANDQVRCAACGASYTMKNGVLDLLPESEYRRPLSQRVMEWERFIRIYESRWFRRGPGFRLISGISFNKEYEIIAQAVNLKNNMVLLDIGCGTGIYLRPLAGELNHGMAVGLDLSMPMLRYASSRAREEGLKNTLFIHGSALSLPFPDNEFDAVVSCATIHLLSIPDLLKVLKEVNRILKRNGCLATACLRQPIPGQLARKFSDFNQQISGTNHFRPEVLEPLFKEAGMENVKCNHSKRYWLIMSAAKPQ